MHRLGPYEIQRELGAGAMGRVYLGWHPLLQQHHAIKVMAGNFSRDDIKRFEREVEVIAAIRHPNVIRVHSAGAQDGQPYYAMEFVEGEELADALKRGCFEEQRAASIIRDLALALSLAHAKGIVHRDLKPANILIDAEGRPKLADFGLAKVLLSTEQLTRTGEALGTPMYMAPEQAMGKRVGPATDIYALGVILYELLVGRPPVSGATATEVMQAVVDGRIDDLDRAAPNVTPALRLIYRRATAWDTRQRYQDATELAADLGAFIAHPEETADLVDLDRPRRRRKHLFALVGLVLSFGAAMLALQQRRSAQVRARIEAKCLALERHCRQLPPTLPRANLERLRGALTELSAGLAKPPPRAAYILGSIEVIEGRNALVAGLSKVASRHFKRAKAMLSPRDPRLQALRIGIMTMEKAPAALTLDLAERTIVRLPKDAELRVWAAWSYQRAGRSAEAAEQLFEAEELGHPAPRLALAIAVAMGEDQKAAALAKRHGLELPPAIVLRRARHIIDLALGAAQTAGVAEQLALLKGLDGARSYLDSIGQRLHVLADGLVNKYTVAQLAPIQEILASLLKIRELYALAAQAAPELQVSKESANALEILCQQVGHTYRTKSGELVSKFCEYMAAILPESPKIQVMVLFVKSNLRPPVSDKDFTETRRLVWDLLERSRERLETKEPYLWVAYAEAVGRRTLSLGRNQEAKKFLLGIMKQSPIAENPTLSEELNLLLARVYRSEGDYKRELESINRAEKGTSDPYLYEKRAQLLASIGRLKEARSDLENFYRQAYGRRVSSLRVDLLLLKALEARSGPQGLSENLIKSLDGKLKQPGDAFALASILFTREQRAAAAGVLRSVSKKVASGGQSRAGYHGRILRSWAKKLEGKDKLPLDVAERLFNNAIALWKDE